MDNSQADSVLQLEREVGKFPAPVLAATVVLAVLLGVLSASTASMFSVADSVVIDQVRNQNEITADTATENGHSDQSDTGPSLDPGSKESSTATGPAVGSNETSSPEGSKDPEGSRNTAPNAESDTDNSAASGEVQYLEGEPGSADSIYPLQGNSGYDVNHYDVELSFDSTTREITSTATIELTPTQGLSSFSFDLRGLEVQKVTVEASEAQFSTDDTKLRIVPTESLDPDVQVTVNVSYHGRPLTLYEPSLDIETGWIDNGTDVYVFGQPISASVWLPVNEHPSDAATYRVAITADSDLLAFTNGELESTTVHGQSTTWVYSSGAQQASYLSTIAIGDFVRIDSEPTKSGVKIRHYCPRGLEAEVEATMKRSAEAIEVYESLFGPYPFEVYGTFTVREPYGVALEIQTLSFFGSDMVSLRGGNERVVVHELAHQWFGDHIRVADWSHIWLNEGFATYSEFLFYEHTEAGYDIDSEIAQDYEARAFSLDYPPAKPTGEDLFNRSVYSRGAYTLHVLRRTVGDETFFRILNTYLNEFGNHHATTSEFIEIAEEVSGQDLQDLFDRWLFDTEIPELDY